MKFTRLQDPKEVSDLIRFHNENSKFVVLDVETTSKEARDAQLIDVQISGYGEDEAVIFGSEIAPLLTQFSKSLVIVAHNYKYDAHVLFRHDINLLSHSWNDTLILGHLLDENRDSHSLESYVNEYWADNYKEEFWGKYPTYLEAPEEERVQYACKDIVYTDRLYRKLRDGLFEAFVPESLIKEQHLLQEALLETEIKGLQVDREYLNELGVRVKVRIDELGPLMRASAQDEIDCVELELWKKKRDGYKTAKGKLSAVKPDFNFESSAQLINLLYNKLLLKKQFNQKTRAISVDFDSLEKIKDRHPIVALIQENRDLQKVFTAYVKGTNDRLSEDRIYPQFRVTGTVTGRLSHNNPNLAQLPKQGGVRGIYVPDRGRVLISADYSQLEVVVEANLTGDKNLIRMLENGESKHDLTARQVGCEYDTAKTLNFCLQYWGTHHKIAKLLGISLDDAEGIYRKYWEVYSGAKRLKAETDRKVDNGVPLQTVFGRMRRFEVRKRSPWDKNYRQAYNFMIQGTGADITNRAFYRMFNWFKENPVGRTWFSVHDEILLECLPEKADLTERVLLETMVGVGNEIGFKYALKAAGSGPMSRWED